MNMHATCEGTLNFKDRFKNKSGIESFKENSKGLWLSTIGFGSYLGDNDVITDINYKDALIKAVELGCNHIDTAINYRFQRSEKAIGNGINVLLNERGIQREEIFISTKGSYIPYELFPPKDAKSYIEENVIGKNLATPDEVIALIHCISPRFLESMIDKSLENLGISSIDLYYVHNPEEQFRAVSKEEFDTRITKVFELLEEKVAQGKIGMYGIATWNGFRLDPSQNGYLSVYEIYRIAENVAGKNHNFKAIQLPINLAMTEAFYPRNQSIDGKPHSVLEAAWKLGIMVVASSPLLQSRLLENLPDYVGQHMKGLDTNAQRALQFARSLPGVTTTLVGMSSIKHVEENMSLAKLPLATPNDISNLFKHQSMH